MTRFVRENSALRTKQLLQALATSMVALVAASACGESEASTCADDDVGIRYEVTIRHNGEQRVVPLRLWRRGDSLLQEQEQGRIAELWERTRNGGLHLVRYFDVHRRAIEYQPDDLGFSSDAPFAERRALLNALCETSEIRGEAPPSRSQATVTAWRRTEIIREQDTISAVFNQRSGYMTTDYADIGDNESDPFLLNMINLGFIEHGSSGFYDSAGHSMSADHPH